MQSNGLRLLGAERKQFPRGPRELGAKVRAPGLSLQEHPLLCPIPHDDVPCIKQNSKC